MILEGELYFQSLKSELRVLAIIVAFLLVDRRASLFCLMRFFYVWPQKTYVYSTSLICGFGKILSQVEFEDQIFKEFSR